MVEVPNNPLRQGCLRILGRVNQQTDSRGEVQQWWNKYVDNKYMKLDASSDLSFVSLYHTSSRLQLNMALPRPRHSFMTFINHKRRYTSVSCLLLTNYISDRRSPFLLLLVRWRLIEFFFFFFLFRFFFFFLVYTAVVNYNMHYRHPMVCDNNCNGFQSV